MNSYYFDHAATTPMHPEVMERMLELMKGPGGNASSIHAYGRAARSRLTRARDLVSSSVGCRPPELLFTSGGTESDNAALIGAARAQKRLGRNHIITSAVEHHAVLHTCEWLHREEGFTLTVVPVDGTGLIDPQHVKDAMTPETALVSVMHGNNEVGTLQPIEAIGDIAHAGGALFHVDAVQSLGWMQYRLQELPVDFMSFSAHKINGPQGVGALYVRTGVPFEALQHGGSQERKRRAGTENVVGIAGFAAALDICVNERPSKQLFTEKLRKRWIELLKEELHHDVEVVVNGHATRRLPHIANLSFIGVDTESMLMNLDMSGIAASSGSACTSGSLERSHVLEAMKLPPERLQSAVRFSFGLGNTMEEIQNAAPLVARIASRIRTSK
ncbi:cysteine desulfurase [Paenibacillus sp. J5C_2022]|uniref:cysteine desulfurase family protein n=1 Tax=Paenibacillus sp. J5C2022 TaxID=2977129 RepID=UPI0021D00A48|nr:cysteine desulfurase family protein [Paenibacillus sp. J5C2022]MCU6709659.1 cysteine desulfurase [Paenibacillus sp. J5C2022]